MNDLTTNPNRLLRRTEVEILTGRSRSSIYQGIEEGTFPKPIKIGARAVAWPVSTIQNWISAKIEGSEV